MKDDAVPRPSGAALARRLWRGWIAPHWPRVAAAVALSGVVAATATAYAAALKYALDWIDALDPRVVWLAPLALVGLAVIRSLALWAQTLQTNRLALGAMRDLQQAMYDALVRADVARLSGEAPGALVSRFVNDVAVLREFLIRAFNNLVKDVLTIAGAIAVMFWADWLLAILVLVVYPLAAMPVVRIGRRQRKISGDAQAEMGAVAGFLEESFSGARMVRAYGLEEAERQRAHTAFGRRFQALMDLARGKAPVDPILEVAGGIGLAGVIAFIGWRILDGASTLGDIGAFVAAVGLMAPAVRAIGTLNAVAQEGYAALDRVFAVIDERPAIADAPGAAPLPQPVRGEVGLRDVTFAYAPDAPALHGVSLEARRGETVALVGPSGAGKSSVLNLILRFYDADSGAVTVDGRDLRGLTLASLRGAMAFVSQDVTIFDASAADNIAFGRPGATRAEIEAAAKAAAAHDFIAALPGGYDAPLGPRGARLSGGQRQRIALARAFLRDAPILLLDEATSALDSESERQIQDALAKLSQGRTVIVIAHRLSTVMRADRIYVFDAGRIVETGRHEDLIAKGGLYAQLAALQFREG